MDDADMGSKAGTGADAGLKSGRHTRVNFNNYLREHNRWVVGPEVQGEGVFECFNGVVWPLIHARVETVLEVLTALSLFVDTHKLREMLWVAKTEVFASQKMNADAYSKSLFCIPRSNEVLQAGLVLTVQCQCAYKVFLILPVMFLRHRGEMVAIAVLMVAYAYLRISANVLTGGAATIVALLCVKQKQPH